MSTAIMNKPVEVESSSRKESHRAGPVAQVGFRNAVRVQTSLLAPIERVCLSWLAVRMPAWVKPDHLTALALGAMLLAGVFYGLARWWWPSLLLVNLMLAVNWFGDSLDGTLARARKQERPRYGFYVDHMSDALSSLFIILGMAASGYMSLMVALAALVVYSLLSINVYLATYTLGRFRISFYKFSPTELRIALALGNLAILRWPRATVFGERYMMFDVGAVVAMVVMGLILIASIVANTIELYRQERV